MKITLIWLIVLVCATVLFGQTVNKNTSKTAAELMQLERDMARRTSSVTRRFFSGSRRTIFIFTDSGGGLTTKAEDVAGLDQPAGELKLVSYVVDEMKVFDYGKTAVVLAA